MGKHLVPGATSTILYREYAYVPASREDNPDSRYIDYTCATEEDDEILGGDAEFELERFLERGKSQERSHACTATYSIRLSRSLFPWKPTLYSLREVE